MNIKRNILTKPIAGKGTSPKVIVSYKNQFRYNDNHIEKYINGY